MNRPLLIVETHPVQYHAPVYRAVQAEYGIPVDVIYGSDYSVSGCRDIEFGVSFAWDVDLTGGMRTTFLSTVAKGGARSAERVSARGLGKALNRTGAAAVLLNGYQHRLYRAAFFYAWCRRLPIFLRAETTDHARRRNPVHRYIRDQVLRRLYEACSSVLPIGSRSHQHYRRLGVPERKMISSPYCIDTSPFRCDETDRDQLRPQIRSELDLAPDDVVILFSGKLSVRKGVHVLTQAVKLLPNALRSKFVLLFLGAGQEERGLVHSCETDPAIRARFLGFRNQTQLSPYYHAADLLVLPSVESETWGLVVNEALHHGLPCVASDAVGCALDLIEPAVIGEIAKTGCARSLAATLERALSLTRQPLVRSRCRDKVSQFTVSKAAEGIAKAYRQVVGSADSPAFSAVEFV